MPSHTSPDLPAEPPSQPGQLVGRGDQVSGGLLLFPTYQRLKASLDLADARGWPVGLDTETVGANPKEVTAYKRAEVVYWSLGVPTGMVGARGQVVCQRVLLGRSQLYEYRDWLEGPQKKVLYNAPWDLHAIEFTAGIDVANWHDALRYARLVEPSKFVKKDLKAVMGRELGYTPVGEFKELFSEPVTKVVFKKRWEDHCNIPEPFGGMFRPISTWECPDCNIRGVNKGRRQVEYSELKALASRKLIDLREIEPGHRLWWTMQDYATLDAKATCEIWWTLRAKLAEKEVRVPWLP